MFIGIDPETVKQIPYWIFLYQDNHSYKQVADKCKVPRSRVYTALRNFGFIEKDNVRLMKLGANNPVWRGDKVQYTALHAWVKRNYKKPNLCQSCNERPALDLANISNTYNPETYTRNISNWEWLCRRCHMTKDGRMNNLKRYDTKPSV